MRTSGRTISTKGTSSPASCDRISCTRAIERMRRTDSSIAALASGDDEPAALQAQQRRDRLQVVLHPVVDLADRGVLRHAAGGHGGAARRCRAAARPRRSPSPCSSSGMQRISTVTCGPRSISSVSGTAVANAVRTAVSSRPELAEAHALGVGVHADAVQGRHRVRRGVLDPGRRRRAGSRRRRRGAPPRSGPPRWRTGTRPPRSCGRSG